MLNDKMNALIEEVSGCLAEREELVHTLALALLTRKNLFVLGKPGQAKSLAIDLFRERITGARQFNVLMSKGIDQEQLFGRLDLASIIPGHIARSILENDPVYRDMKAEMEISLEHMRSDPGNRGYIDEVKKQSDTMAAYEKGMAQLYSGTPQMITENKIPDSHICFADEIFKANEGVLNSLLKALNERTYTNEGVTVKIPVISFVSASNEIPNFNDPEEQSLRALYDRFDFKVNTRYVEAKENRMRMLKSKQSRKSDKPTHTVTLSELEAMQEEVRQIPIPQSINELADTILCELRRKKIPVSDRTYFNFGAVVQAEAWLNGRTTVAPVDMQALVNYLWDKPEQYEVIREVITRLTENPLGKKLDAALARAYACRDAFRAASDKNQALLTFRTGMVAVYDTVIGLKNGLDENDAALSSIDSAVATLESVSREIHGETSFTYLPLTELKAMQTLCA